MSISNNNVPGRIAALRDHMRANGITACIVPTGDYHMSEYLAEYFMTREFLTGFTGSAGTAVVTKDDAVLWTDSRYYIQAAAQLEGTGITLCKMQEPGTPTIPGYLKEHLSSGDIAAFDGRVVSSGTYKSWSKDLEGSGIEMKDDYDPFADIWEGRPELPCNPVYDLPLQYSGRSREDKLKDVRDAMQKEGADYLFLASLTDIAWLLNLRGADVHCTPVFLSYLLVGRDTAVLYINKEELSDEICSSLEAAGVCLADYDKADEGLRSLEVTYRPGNIDTNSGSGVTLWVPSGDTSCYLTNCVPEDVRILDKPSPTVILKSVKNETEQKNFRLAHIKDGVAVTKWIYWLKKNICGVELSDITCSSANADEIDHSDSKASNCTVKQQDSSYAFNLITEISAAEKLHELRSEQENFVDDSFDPIVAYGEHAAIVHYSSTPETDVPLEPRGLLLADTGGHYLEGTTDITRTIALGELTDEERKMFTAVLMGHLRLAAAVFPKGLNGGNLDYLAHSALWPMHKDFGHGTGHGVGYLLNVHEGPQSLSWRCNGLPRSCPAFETGMNVTDEPGYYEEGKFGIRHENVLLCVSDGSSEYGEFLRFEPLTMVPFDLDAIDRDMMTAEDIALLNSYHQAVYDTISEYLSNDEKAWLKESTRVI